MKRNKFLRWIALPVAVFLLVLGAITLPLPLPTGILLIALGLAVATLNPLMLRWIKRTRRKYPETSAKIRDVTPRLPAFLRNILNRTDSPSR
jgi:hypothetical protein